MSQRALLLAVRDRLRQPTVDGGLAYTAEQCEVMFDGKPKPNCGEFFVAVHAGSWTGRDCEALDESYGVQVTVTRRIAYAPYDRPTDPLTDASDALDKLLEAIRAKLHADPGPRAAADPQQYPVLTLANAYIANPANKFVEPLRFRDGGTPAFKGADWFHAEGVGDECGVAQTLTFGGARRVQTIESET